MSGSVLPIRPPCSRVETDGVSVYTKQRKGSDNNNNNNNVGLVVTVEEERSEYQIVSKCCRSQYQLYRQYENHEAIGIYDQDTVNMEGNKPDLTPAGLPLARA